jgi:general stress protein CsbA
MTGSNSQRYSVDFLFLFLLLTSWSMQYTEVENVICGDVSPLVFGTAIIAYSVRRNSRLLAGTC